MESARMTSETVPSHAQTYKKYEREASQHALRFKIVTSMIAVLIFIFIAVKIVASKEAL